MNSRINFVLFHKVFSWCSKIANPEKANQNGPVHRRNSVYGDSIFDTLMRV